MHVYPGFLIREIAGECIVIPSGAAAQQISGLLSLNGSGKLLFELLQTDQSEQALAQALVDSYEVDIPTAQKDVAEFLAILEENGVLCKSET